MPQGTPADEAEMLRSGGKADPKQLRSPKELVPGVKGPPNVVFPGALAGGVALDTKVPHPQRGAPPGGGNFTPPGVPGDGGPFQVREASPFPTRRLWPDIDGLSPIVPPSDTPFNSGILPLGKSPVACSAEAHPLWTGKKKWDHRKSPTPQG
jgi:hypothetical protein